MRRYFLVVTLFLILFTPELSTAKTTSMETNAASASSASWEGKLITEILLEENPPIPEATLQTLIDFKSGDRFQARLIRESVARLYETGKFREVWVLIESVDQKNVRLKFRWFESKRLDSIQISGNRHLSEAEIINALGHAPGDRFSEASWSRGLENIASLYRERGYFLAKAASQLKPSADNRQGMNAEIQIREGSRARIRKISFPGRKVFSDWMLRFEIYSNKGELYDGERLKEDLWILQEFYTKKGYFKAVIGPVLTSYDEAMNEIDISLSIQAMEKIHLIFEGEKLLAKKELISRVLIQKERSDDEDVLEESIKQLLTYYQSEGYPLVEASYTVEEDKSSNQKTIRFLIQSGAIAKIKTILLPGRFAFSEKRLRQEIILNESSFFGKTLYTKVQHQKDADSLSRFYQSRGFLNSTVKPVVQFNTSEELAWLLFRIDEGNRTRIDQFELFGNVTLPTVNLINAMSIHSGMPFTNANVQEGKRDLLEAYAASGYLFTDIQTTLRFSSDPGSDQSKVVIGYHIFEGKQVRLGRISLEGNLRTRAGIIERELLIQAGEPYAPGLILESQRAIYQTGLFSSVSFEKFDLEEANPMLPVQNVRLKLQERASISLEFGGGYADRERMRGFLQLSHRNLWGSNRQLSLRGEASTVEERYFLNYKEPWFFRKSIDARITLAYLNLEEVSFDLKTFSGVIGINKSFSKKLKGSLLYQIERNEISNVDPTSQQAPEDIGFFTIATLNPSLIYDTRDDAFNPTTGTLSSINFRNGANILGSEIQVVKLTIQSRWYHQVSKKIVLALSARTGLAKRFAETESIPISERFFLGGRNTVRGYDQDKLGILGETLINGSPTGGNAMLVFNEEIRISLPRSFGTVLFLDHGNVWLERNQVDPSDVKSSAGLGLRYNTPIGPFRLDWAHKLNRESGEDPWVIHFSLGHAF